MFVLALTVGLWSVAYNSVLDIFNMLGLVLSYRLFLRPRSHSTHVFNTFGMFSNDLSVTLFTGLASINFASIEFGSEHRS